MTFSNLGINSASTKDWLEAMKNQSSSGVEPRNSGGIMNSTTATEPIVTRTTPAAKKADSPR